MVTLKGKCETEYTSPQHISQHSKNIHHYDATSKFSLFCSDWLIASVLQVDYGDKSFPELFIYMIPIAANDILYMIPPITEENMLQRLPIMLKHSKTRPLTKIEFVWWALR